MDNIMELVNESLGESIPKIRRALVKWVDIKEDDEIEAAKDNDEEDGIDKKEENKEDENEDDGENEDE